MNNPNDLTHIQSSNEIENVAPKDVPIHLHIQTIGALNTVFGSIGTGMLLLFVCIGVSMGITWLNSGQEMFNSGGLISQICGGLVIFYALPMLASVFLLIFLPYFILLLVTGIGLLKKQFWARILGIGLAGFQIIVSIVSLFSRIFLQSSSAGVDPNMMAPPPPPNTSPIIPIVISLLALMYSVYTLVVLASRRAGAYFQQHIINPKQ
ncbi:MAG TPA: hypothetical protein VNK49_07400 [Anaerolineales bacterium]|nr:hypothetical protein [Anaerolineales bacterium]